MSLSIPKLQNPCKKFIEFKGDTGIFQYWNKEDKKNVIMPDPILFIVLDELCTISGFDNASNSGIYSNEVKNITTQTMNVRAFKGKLSIVGKYADIKGDIKATGGKFCKSVYAALLVNDTDLELVNFQLKGISFSSWVNKTIDIASQGVKIGKCTDGKKGNITFKVPSFEAFELNKDLLDKAIAMDKSLQEYLSAYQKKNEHEISQSPAIVKPEDDDIPY